MALSVDLSDELIRSAQARGKSDPQAVATKIELWARLGRAVEPLLTSAQEESPLSPKPLLSELLATVDKPEGRARLKAYLASQPSPHFEPDPLRPEVFVRIEADGTRTTGRFVGRKFQVIE